MKILLNANAMLTTKNFNQDNNHVNNKVVMKLVKLATVTYQLSVLNVLLHYLEI